MQKKTILVIDDDPVILNILQPILEDAGYTVQTATSGADGLALLESTPANLIILDRNMPNLSGIEVLERLKTLVETAAIPVIMLTGERNMAQISESLELGAKDYIVKPFDPQNLLIRIRKAI